MHAPRRGRRSSLGVERTVVVAFVEPRRRVCRSGAVYVSCVASCVRFARVGGVCRQRLLRGSGFVCVGECFCVIGCVGVR